MIKNKVDATQIAVVVPLADVYIDFVDFQWRTFWRISLIIDETVEKLSKQDEMPVCPSRMKS